VSRSRAARERQASRRKRAVTTPFATIPTTLLATQRMRKLPGVAIRVLLRAEADWTPHRPVPLPVSQIAENLRAAKRRVCTAIGDLIATGLLERRDLAIRPGRMGCAGKGKAATFELPHRRKLAGIGFDPGDKRLSGHWRVYSAELRKLAADLSDNTARVLVCVILPCHRDKHGRPADNAPFALSAGEVGKLLPDISAASLNRVASELVRLGLVRVVEPPAGRRPALYVRAGLAAEGIQRIKGSWRRSAAAIESAPIKIAAE
jgi:hypothetical protein